MTITSQQIGKRLWKVDLLDQQNEPVVYSQPPYKGEPVTYFVPATAAESVLYAAKKQATRDGIDHANSDLHWSMPEVVPGRVLIG